MKRESINWIYWLLNACLKQVNLPIRETLSIKWIKHAMNDKIVRKSWVIMCKIFKPSEKYSMLET